MGRTKANQDQPDSHTRSLASIQSNVLEIVRDLVGADVQLEAPLVAQGLDSLAAMELRQKLQVRSLHETALEFSQLGLAHIRSANFPGSIIARLLQLNTSCLLPDSQ